MSDLTPLGAARRDRASTSPGTATPPTSGGDAAWRHPLHLATAGAALTLATLWVVHVARATPLLGPGRIALAALMALGGGSLLRLRSAGWRRRRARTLGAAGLLLLALTLRLSGVTHELVEQSYLDEGTYLHHAQQIDAGQWVRGSFVYPHLLYNSGAMALWISDLVAPLSSRLARALADQRLPAAANPLVAAAGPDLRSARDRLALRLLVALLGAFAVLPVAWLGGQLGGPLVGLLAGAAWIFSPLVNEGAHLVISDWPSACFAACALALAMRWYECETWAVASAAGAAAGLAAGAKYPAGVVALALIGVWLSHRIGPRSSGRSSLAGARGLLALPLAGATSLAVFLAVSPTFFVDPAHALLSPRGMLFGLRQYGGGGWLGVQPDSNAVYYLERLGESFGWPLLVTAACGLALLLRRPTPTRTRLLWALPFPVAYLALLAAMSMVVKRNLAPVMPALCALVALGAFVVLARLVAASQRVALFRGTPARVVLVALVLLALFAVPVAETVRQSLALARPSTRELATARLAAQLPPGVHLLKESYTPRLHLAESWGVRSSNSRFLARRPLEELLAGEYDYLLASSSAYTRFVREDAELEGHHVEMSATYQRLFDELPEVWRLRPGRWREGPVLRLLAVEGTTAGLPLDGAELAREAVLPDDSMRGAAGLRFTLPGQWALLRLSLRPGDELALEGHFPGGAQSADGAHARLTRRAQPQALERMPSVSLLGSDDGQGLTVRVPDLGEAGPQATPGASSATLIYLFLPEGSVLEGVRHRSALELNED